MFVPQPINAQSWLKDRKDPAKAIAWWPTASYVSCDGSLAVNTGGWKRPDGAAGYFSTVWQRQPDGGWKWIVDGGDDLKVARSRSANPKVVTASCIKIPRAIPKKSKTEPRYGGGESGDQSLTWEWGYSSAGNIRVFSAYLWDGRRTVDAIDDVIFLK
ncbi:hypothetical protein [Sphingomonas sp.]|uniref:hypothetical protein n=1 Tax=Sphingomonas sp. TaxID=28214 RepID=UPI003340EC7C